MGEIGAMGWTEGGGGGGRAVERVLAFTSALAWIYGHADCLKWRRHRRRRRRRQQKYVVKYFTISFFGLRGTLRIVQEERPQREGEGCSN